MFIIPKKDGHVHWITDFHGLNKILKHKVYPMCKISDVFQCQSGYCYFTKLDISMQYYTFILDEDLHNLCTFTTPLRLYHYCHLPMGSASLLTFLPKSCSKFWTAFKILNSTWMTLDISVMIGTPISISCTRF